MWIEEITLEGIKCFQQEKIRLGSKEKPYNWVTLLGENGSGKSTVLQALALLLAGPEGAPQLLKPVGWLNSNQTDKAGKITLRLHQGDNDPNSYGNKEGGKGSKKTFQYTFYVTGEQRVIINNQAFNEPTLVADTNNRILPWLRENVFTAKGDGWFGAGYGAFRRLTRKSRILVPQLQQPSRFTNFQSQFIEDEPLEAFETWLVYLDYRVSKSNDELSKKHLELGIQAINQLLPEGNQFDSIDENGRIWFNTGSTKAATAVLSDGFRSVMALVGDLVWRLIEAFPKSENPLHEQGVVLIDELDIHLHPTWQREIAWLLSRTFPNIQFIVATHSPFIATGLPAEDAVTYRFYKRDGRIEVERIKNIHSQPIDKVLESEAFGLVSSFSKDTQAKIDKYYSLKKNKQRNPTEELQLQELTLFVQEALGNTQAIPKDELSKKIDAFLSTQFVLEDDKNN